MGAEIRAVAEYHHGASQTRVVNREDSCAQRAAAEGGFMISRQLVSIALRSGWHFRLSQEGGRYHAELTAPVRGQSVTLRYWPSVERVLEAVCTNHLKLTAGLPEVAASLRSRVETELR